MLAAQAQAASHEDVPVWTNAEAVPRHFDWIQLTSGEWLKGDLKVLYNDSLDFDSVELEMLTFDWEDVQQLRCHAPQSILLEMPASESEVSERKARTQTVVGVLRIDGDNVFIDTGEEILAFHRDALISIASGESQELDHWSAKLTLSLDITQGNTDQLNYGTYLNAKRQTSHSRLYMEYRGNISYLEGAETSNNQRINGYYDIFASRSFFWRPVFAEYYRDPFANIAYRSTVGTGVGYTIIDTPGTELLIAPGIAYQQTRFDSTESGEADSISTPALVVSTEFDTDLTRKVEFYIDYKFYVVNKASGTYSHHAVSGLEMDVTGRLELDLSIVWDRTQDPEPLSDGTVPEQDDVHLFFGISFEL